jgi:hypothetical protein
MLDVGQNSMQISGLSGSVLGATQHQINQMRAGATPPCLHQASLSPQSLRGPSQPLGILEIKDRVLNFKTINTNALNGVLVDFWGKSVDMAPIIDVIRVVPIDTDLTVSQFGEIGSKLRSIGEVDNAEHGRCMFTMDYIIDDFVGSNDMFIRVFQSYFLPQNKVGLSNE